MKNVVVDEWESRPSLPALCWRKACSKSGGHLRQGCVFLPTELQNNIRPREISRAARGSTSVWIKTHSSFSGKSLKRLI